MDRGELFSISGAFQEGARCKAVFWEGSWKIKWRSVEEVLAFLFGEKPKIGFLDEQDVIRSEAVQEIPGEVLKQLGEEEAEIDPWMQAE